MRRPVDYYKVQTVQRLIKAGLSARAAAREAGMSNRTASKIANGQHVSQFSEDSEVVFTTVPAYECPGCHRQVTTAPCVACSGRRA